MQRKDKPCILTGAPAVPHLQADPPTSSGQQAQTMDETLWVSCKAEPIYNPHRQMTKMDTKER